MNQETIKRVKQRNRPIEKSFMKGNLTKKLITFPQVPMMYVLQQEVLSTYCMLIVN